MSGQQLFGLVLGINGNDKFAGCYWDTQISATHGFVGRKGVWKADVNVPTENQFGGALGINDSNVIVGYFFAPPLQGFVLSGKNLSSTATGTILVCGSGSYNQVKKASHFSVDAAIGHQSKTKDEPFCRCGGAIECGQGGNFEPLAGDQAMNDGFVETI